MIRFILLVPISIVATVWPSWRLIRYDILWNDLWAASYFIGPFALLLIVTFSVLAALGLFAGLLGSRLSHQSRPDPDAVLPTPTGC
jgi:hypothetical protein